MSSRFRQIFGMTLVLLLLGSGVALSRALDYLDEPMAGVTAREVYELKPGTSFRAAVLDLREAGLLKWPRVLALYARITGDATQIHAGEYALTPGITPRQLLEKLTAGDVIQRVVTLVEGSDVRSAIATVQGKEGIVVTPDLTPALLAREFELPATDNAVEGWLFPDTYRYPKGMRDIDLLTIAYRRMQSILAEEWELRADGLPYKDAYEALIMASIVEKETGVPEERTRIAGVFVRRLERKMKLQTDPTIIYGLGPEFDGNLRSRHLRDKSNPYNTYQIRGLPPTPIALPGRAAIYAALHPAPGDSLYFVARGDGSHYFSETLAEHSDAVRKYQIEQRRKDYRSSPQ